MKKRSSYNCTFRNYKPYKLCFPDGSKVATLPGTIYIGKVKGRPKTYTCITLFLCPLDDASDTEPEQHCTSELECLESLSDAWLNNVDLGKDDTDILPAFDIFQRSPVTSSSTTACATTSGSFTSTPSV